MDGKNNIEVKDRIELQQSEIIKKSLILLGFLLLFAALTVPLYFLMTAGTHNITGEVTVEKSVKDPAPDGEGKNIFGEPNPDAATEKPATTDPVTTDTTGSDTFGTTDTTGSDLFGTGDSTGDNPFGTTETTGTDPFGTQDTTGVDPFGSQGTTGSDSFGTTGTGTDTGYGISDESSLDGFQDFGNETVPGTKTQTASEEYMQMRFRLNGLAFFGGMLLIIILYIVYFEAVLKKLFHPLMQGDRTALIAGLVAFLIFVLAEIVEVSLIPNHITKGLASFTGLPWEIAYVVPVFLVFFTLVGTWVDTNFNRTVYLDDVPFHYTQFGNGGRNLILIAGLNLMTLEGKGVSMAWNFRQFAKDYTVYVMDKRDDVKEDVTLRELAADIAAVAEHIGIITADVVGVSQGGMIAQYLTIDNPELVNKLVLAVTSSKMNDSIKAYVNQCVVYAQKGEMEEVLKDSFENDFTEAYTKPLKPFMSLITKFSVPKSNTRFIRLARSINSLNTYEELDQIKCPVYVIGAGKDRIVTVAESEAIAEKLNCKKFIYQNLGHGVYSEAKDFNERVLKFLMRG